MTARAAAIAVLHVASYAGLVDENRALRVQLALARTPLITRFGCIRTILLGSMLGRFFSGSLISLPQGVLYQTLR